MRELTKVLCVVALLFGAPLAAVAWSDDRVAFPRPVVLFMQYGCPALCVLAVGIFFKVRLRPDEVPEYLGRCLGTYFNRGGFCFAIRPVVAEGVCTFEVYFQNQYENRCVGRAALRPARGFLLGRARVDAVLVEIDCGPAAFGVARVAVPLPPAVQGRRQRFEVGASVEYPDGKGRRLRFGDGVTLRANSNFGDKFATGLLVAGAVTGQIVYTSPATATIDLPEGVAEEVPDNARLPSVETLWQLGDPPLSEAERVLG
ncbi:MAG: hypothetical protein U0871_22585 [Gemmataceae bacterium]